jgi:hypothetical protein
MASGASDTATTVVTRLSGTGYATTVVTPLSVPWSRWRRGRRRRAVDDKAILYLVDLVRATRHRYRDLLAERRVADQTGNRRRRGKHRCRASGSDDKGDSFLHDDSLLVDCLCPLISLSSQVGPAIEHWS